MEAQESAKQRLAQARKLFRRVSEGGVDEALAGEETKSPGAKSSDGEEECVEKHQKLIRKIVRE